MFLGQKGPIVVIPHFPDLGELIHTRLLSQTPRLLPFPTLSRTTHPSESERFDNFDILGVSESEHTTYLCTLTLLQNGSLYHDVSSRAAALQRIWRLRKKCNSGPVWSNEITNPYENMHGGSIPVAPKGCPMAIAPPLTLIFSGSSPSLFRQ